MYATTPLTIAPFVSALRTSQTSSGHDNVWQNDVPRYQALLIWSNTPRIALHISSVPHKGKRRGGTTRVLPRNANESSRGERHTSAHHGSAETNRQLDVCDAVINVVRDFIRGPKWQDVVPRQVEGKPTFGFLVGRDGV